MLEFPQQFERPVETPELPEEVQLLSADMHTSTEGESTMINNRNKIDTSIGYTQPGKFLLVSYEEADETKYTVIGREFREGDILQHKDIFDSWVAENRALPISNFQVHGGGQYTLAPRRNSLRFYGQSGKYGPIEGEDKEILERVSTELLPTEWTVGTNDLL